MYGKTHIVIALVIVLLLYNYLAYFIPLETLLICLGFCALGALLPDIDHPSATIRKPYPAVLALLFLGYVLYKNSLTLYEILPVICLIILLTYSYTTKHRTFTHSLLAMFLYSLCIFPIAFSETFFFLIGYLSHLLADSLTKAGTPFLYPFDKTRYGFKVMRGNQVAEKIILVTGTLLCIYLALKIFNARYGTLFRF